MNENNELNDIILNKGGSANSNKKIILAVATLGVILIIVIMLMNSLSSSGIDNLPKASLPPQPQTELSSQSTQEPLFEDVEVEQDSDTSNSNLEQIAQKLKEESVINEDTQITQPAATSQVKKEAPKQTPFKQTAPKQAAQKQEAPKQAAIKQTPPQQPVAKQVVQKPVQKVAQAESGSFYVQVGSFSKYEPNKKFISSITSLGYNYRYQEANNVNKVLVGPFKTEHDAKEARKVLRAKVEPGAFLLSL
jgi:DedD protein